MAVVLHACALALLASVIVLGLVRPLLMLGRFIPLDPNEGWNAYFGLTAIEGGQLYPPADALITNNYPPLSFYIVGGVGHLIGDNIFAGRLIALLALLFVAWSIYTWLRLTGSAVRIGLLGAGAFLAYAVTYGRDYVAMNDPQWLAQAMMMAGLLLVWRRRDSSRYIAAGCILIMAAGWTKHLLLPIPLAVTAWLLWRSRRVFTQWAVCSIAVLALASGLALRVYGPAFFHNLLAPRLYYRHLAISRMAGALKCFAPLLVLWLSRLLKDRLDERSGFVSLYLLAAAIIAFASSGGVGVDVNAFFDVMIAASLAAALAVETWEDRPAGEEDRPALASAPAAAVWAAPTAAVVLAVYVASYAVSLAPREIQQIRDLDALERAALEDIQLIHAQGHGRAACELPGLCYWAKSQFMVDFFYFGQRLKTGIIAADACARAFDGSGISLLQLDPNPKFRQKLLPEYCNEAIKSHYRPIRASSFGPLLVPAGTSLE